MSTFRCAWAVLWLAGGVVVGAPVGRAEEAVVVKGIVLLPDGKPAEGARLFVAGGGSLVSDLKAPQTDAAGRFSLRLGPSLQYKQVYVATLPGYALGWTFTGPAQELTVRLGGNPVAFAGVVTDLRGRPVAGARLRVYGLVVRDAQHSLIMNWRPFPPLTADDDGRFSLPDLPADSGVQYGVVAAGYVDAAGEVRAGQAEVKIVLAPEASIAGKVTAGGWPAAGARVSAWSEGQVWEATTEAGGAYRLAHLRPGTYTLRVERCGPAGEGYAAPLPVPVALRAGDRRTGQDLALVRAALVTGRVTDAGTGKPLARELVFLSMLACPGGESLGKPLGGATARTDARGAFRLWVLPGRYALRAQSCQPGQAQWRSLPPTRIAEFAGGDHRGGLDFTLTP
ncbi:MAG TPA: carboxypeptidase-like regulatory domain-containing protein [Armatimonadota bacterium]